MSIWRFTKGQPVYAYFCGEWLKAIIMKQTARGIWKVAFSPSDIAGGYGFPVEEDKIREVRAACGAAWLQD